MIVSPQCRGRGRGVGWSRVGVRQGRGLKQPKKPMGFAQCTTFGGGCVTCGWKRDWIGV